jgi:hypothetical protein
MMKVYIYFLHRGDDIPFYIGKTINPKGRLSEHKREKYPNSIMEIIDEVNEEDYIFWESHYIWLFRSWGFNLENKNFGGGGDIGGKPKHTEESKMTIGEKNKGWIPSEEIKEKTGKAAKQRWEVNKEELSKKIKEGREGIKHQNHTKGEEHGNHGKSRSESQKKKMSEVRKGHPPTHTTPHTEETKQVIKMKKTGSKASEETKLKKSIAMKAYWERRKSQW